MNGAIIASIFVLAQLNADTPLNAKVNGNNHLFGLPDKSNYPGVVINIRSDIPHQAAGETEWLASDVRLIIKAVTNERDTAIQAVTIDGLIFNALKDKEGPVFFQERNYFVRMAKREGPVGYDEEAGKDRYKHVGGIYYLVVDSLD